MRTIITFSFVCAWILYCMSIRERYEEYTPTLIKTIIIGSLLIIPLCYFIGFVFPSLEGW